MKCLRWLLLTLVVLCACLATTGGAAALAGDDEQVDKFTKTFRLTLYGNVPRNEVHTVRLFTDDPDDPTGGVVFICLGQPEPGDPTPDCIGNGRLYNSTVELRAGTRIQYAFLRFNLAQPDEDPVAYAEGAETLNSDLTNAAYYDYNTGKGGKGDGPDAPQLPDTGAGGTAGKGFPLGNAVAAFPLLVAGGYAVQRRQ